MTSEILAEKPEGKRPLYRLTTRLEANNEVKL
jgi:hypothetical protein